MLKGGLWSRALGRSGLAGNSAIFRQFARISRGFAGAEDDEGGDPPGVIEDDLDSGSSRNKVKPVEYQFYGKNIAIVLENPLFPYNNKVVHLGKYHAKVTPFDTIAAQH
jgi:hypothetical protein